MTIRRGTRGGVVKDVKAKASRPPRERSTAAGKKKAVPYHLPEQMAMEMYKAVVSANYGLKGKSNWVGEAIAGFLGDRSWCDQVLDGDIASGNAAKDNIYIDADLHQRLDEAVARAQRYYIDEVAAGMREARPEGARVTRAAIIRSAIVWRLFRLQSSLGEPNEGEATESAERTGG